MNSLLKLVFLFIILATSTVQNVCAEQYNRTGFFTNLFYHEEGGDILGFELYIIPTRTGYSGALLFCQGACDPLYIIEPTFDGDSVTFNFTDVEGIAVRFEGVVDQCGITGGFHYPHGAQPPSERLKRKTTYWN